MFILPCMSSHHPPGCSWQQGLCVQSSSCMTGTPYLRQSDDSTTAAVEEEMVEQALQGCIVYITYNLPILLFISDFDSHRLQ